VIKIALDEKTVLAEAGEAPKAQGVSEIRNVLPPRMSVL
jgi:hypothetical protein